MGLRYCIRPATSVDVAFLAAVMDESRDPWTDGEKVPIDRLLQTCACSAQIWAARDTTGTPTALWGVAPMSDDPEVGHLWMLACEAFDNEPEELQELSRLVFGEMLGQFPRLETIIDSRKVRAPSSLPCPSYPPTPTSVSSGSIPTDCIAVAAPGCCPTDTLFSFAGVSEVWVT